MAGRARSLGLLLVDVLRFIVHVPALWLELVCMLGLRRDIPFFIVPALWLDVLALRLVDVPFNI